MNEVMRGEWTSASNALADRLCRGRHQAQHGLSELPRTDESESGTVIHALWTGKGPFRKPTAEEEDQAEALREQERQLANEFFGTGQDWIRLVEHRLWHEFGVDDGNPKDGLLKTSGQFDVALIQTKSRRALILDGKSGWLPVSPNPSNLQLRRLAALLWLQLNPMEIGVSILQPSSKPEPVCIYGMSDLEHSVRELEHDVRQSHSREAIRTAGTDQCRYCRARANCSTRLAWLAAALPPSWPMLPMGPAQDWSATQRAQFLEREKDARDWLEARKAEIKSLLEENATSVPGYFLKPGRIVETITDPQEVLKRFGGRWGGTLDAFLRCIKVGKTALKEEVRLLTHHTGKALEADLKTLLAGCVESKTGAPTIERTNRSA